MLENDSEPSKRQAHPRNRTNNRRNSRGDPPHRPDRLDRPSPTGCETGEKLGSSNANAVAVFEQSSSTDKFIKASGSATSISGQVEMNGWGNCEALRLMNERWKAALQSQNDPTLDVADRPIVFCSSEGSSAWSSSKAS